MSHSIRSYLDDPAYKAYIKMIRGIPMLTRDEERIVAEKSRLGDETARRRLVLSNLRFVVFVATKFLDRGLTVMELISSGNFGLMEAAKLFDERKGWKFISYATYWVQRIIQESLDDVRRAARLPGSALVREAKLRRVRNRLTQERVREPSAAEMAEELRLPLEDVTDTLTASSQPLSFDDAGLLQNGHHDGDDDLHDRLADDRIKPADEQFLNGCLRSELLAVLEKFPKRQREVIILHYGLNGDAPLNMAEIGRRLMVSREFVRLKKNEALKRLRHLSRVQKLKLFLG